jgi:hypothetical protein
MTFPTDPKTGEWNGWREAVAGAAITLEPRTDLIACQRLLAASMAPALPPNIGMWLTEVAHITAKRSEDADSAMLTMTAYIKRLVDYPGDIVRQTLLEWSGKWFPTWGELKEILDARMAERNAISNALIAKMGGKALPKMTPLTLALDGMSPDQKYEELMKRARFARSRDPDYASELENEAVKQLAEASASAQKAAE